MITSYYYHYMTHYEIIFLGLWLLNFGLVVMNPNEMDAFTKLYMEMEDGV